MGANPYLFVALSTVNIQLLQTMQSVNIILTLASHLKLVDLVREKQCSRKNRPFWGSFA